MIIGTVRLLELVKELNLVEGLCKRELENPEGEGFDLRIGSIHKLDEKSSGYLGLEERSTPEIIHSIYPRPGVITSIDLYPKEYRLMKTIEKINLPNNISAMFQPRTTLLRSGILFESSNASPGYSGELTFGLYNIGTKPFRIELGSRIVTAIFDETTDNVSGYRGQWKGGRMSTGGDLEKQV